MTSLAFGLIETHAEDSVPSPGRVSNADAGVIGLSGDVPEIVPHTVTVATPRLLDYKCIAQRAPVHEQTHIIPPAGMVATYSAPKIGTVMSLPFELLTTHAEDNGPIPDRVKKTTARVIKMHGDSPTATPGIGRMVTPDPLNYQADAQTPHVQFAYIIPPGTYVQFHAAKVVVNTRLDVRPSKMESRYKAPKTDTWQPGLCNPPDVTTRYRASKIVLNMDAVLTPQHVSLRYSAASVTFGHEIIKRTPVDIVCYYAAAQVDVDDGAQRHPLTVATVRGDFSAARVHTLTIQTVIPDILDYAAVAQVPDVHRYFIRPKYGPILEIDRAGRVIELDRDTAIIELTKSEEDN